MPTKPPVATMAEIAKEADVAVATVSKVLNGRPGVGAEKRDLILKLLDQHGYQRRGGQTRKPARLIDFVMRGIDTPWATQMLVGAEDEASRAQVGLVVSSSHGRLVGNKLWLDRLAERHSDGVVVVASRIQDGVDLGLARLRVPYVLVDMVGTPPPGAMAVGCTNSTGGRDATDHLIELGHRRIAMIIGPRDLACSQERLDGYRAALARADIQLRPDYVQVGDFEMTGGYRAALRLFDLAEPPTAIFAGSDLQAYGVFRAAAERGVSIPDDLSVVGFDDVPMCEWMTPHLTTIRQPLEEMARQAMRTVLAMAYQNTVPVAPKIELATRLIVRGSTAPPPQARPEAPEED